MMNNKYNDTKSYVKKFLNIKKIKMNLRVHINNFSLTFLNHEIMEIQFLTVKS